MPGRLSRPAVTGPLGKNDTRIQTMVPEVAALDFRRLCAELHVTDSELLRTLVLQRLYGDDAVEASRIAQYRAMVRTASRTMADPAVAGASVAVGGAPGLCATALCTENHS